VNATASQLSKLCPGVLLKEEVNELGPNTKSAGLPLVTGTAFQIMTRSSHASDTASFPVELTATALGPGMTTCGPPIPSVVKLDCPTTTSAAWSLVKALPLPVNVMSKDASFASLLAT
jgi:hypothetical protein